MLINDVLDISKIEANELKLEIRPFNLYEFIEQTALIFAEKAKQKSLQLSFHINAKVPHFVLGDSHRLKQVLYNLFSNAIKFTENGEITLHVSNLTKNSHILFEISDSGIGLAKDQMDKIFEPFSQADETVTRKYGGTGLGLSITKKLVILMDGNIFVTDNKKAKSGASFIFDCRLPECNRPSDLKSKQIFTEDFLNKNLNILIAEDSLDNQLLIRLFLGKTKFSLTFANNGQEAYNSFTRSQYDFILMDMQMPIMGGLEATEKIREFEKNLKGRTTPIIGFTADALVEHIVAMKSVGCDDVLTKPANKVQILECIFQWTQAESSEITLVPHKLA
jgi:CheY-like chemotaxis protein